MKRVLFLSLGILLFVSACGAQGGPVDPVVPTPTIKPSATPPVPAPLHLRLPEQGVALLLPPGHQSNGGPYPILVFSHGYSLDEYQVFQRTNFPRLAQKEGWILASGSLGGDHWGNPKAVAMQDELLDLLVERYRGDPQKIYLVGFSMGAGTALMCGIEGKHRPAAIAASQGWSDLSTFEEQDKKYVPSIRQAYGIQTLEGLSLRAPLNQAEKLKGIPLYLEHGRYDQEIPVKHCERLHDRLDALGIEHQYRLFNSGHAESNIDAPGIVSFLRGKSTPIMAKMIE